MDEREKESQVEERSEVITEEGTERREEEEIQEDPAIGEAVAEEEDRCEEDPECHSSAKRARVCATFTKSKSKLGFYVPFNSQGHIGTGPQNCHLWDSNPQR